MALTLKSIPGAVSFTGRCGVNVGLPMNSWGFTAIPGHVYQTDPWLGKFTTLWSDANLQYIYNKGYDHIRLLFDEGTFCTELAANGNVANTRFDYYWTSATDAIDKILSNGLKVMYDGSHGANSTSSFYDGVWIMDNLLAGLGDTHYITWKAMWSILAGRIAARYSPADVAIELLNEPNGTNQAGWNATIAPDLYAAVRAAAPKHTIAVGASSFNSIDTLPNLVPANFGANTIYVIHPYLPTLATLQSATGYSWFNGLEWPPAQARKTDNITTMTANVNASSLSSGDKTATISQQTTDVNTYYSTPMDRSYLSGKFDPIVTWCTSNSIAPDSIWCGEFGVSQDFAASGGLGADIRTRANLYGALIHECNKRGFRWSLFDMTYSDYDLTDASASQWAGIGNFYPQLLPSITPPRNRGAAPQIVSTADWDNYQGTNHTNGFWWENDVWGKGSFVNGTDYYQRLKAVPAAFPTGAIMEWSWPDATGGQWAYGYPEITYGRRPGGNNPFSYSGPWPQTINTLKTLRMAYSITLGGNTNSFSTLVDLFVTSDANPSDLTTLVAEVSFIPTNNDPTPTGTLHQFTNSVGASYYAKVNNNGASPCPQLTVEPCTSDGSATVNMNSAVIDLIEIFNYMIAQGWLTGNEYVQGIEFGAEPQSPNAFNSTPHTGSVLVNSLSYIWI